MRVLVGGFSHESNSLNPIITGINDFVIFKGAEVLSKGQLPYYSSTGIIRTLQSWGWEAVPAVVARAVPNGVVEAKLYYSLKEDFLNIVKAEMQKAPIDGICLGLHGSMKVEGLGPAEGDLLESIRELLPDVPLTVALDMHATITEKMIRCCTAMVGYKTAPHIDTYETGVHAARLLKAAFESAAAGKKLCMSVCRVPMLIAGEKSESAAEPMKSLLAECAALEKSGEVLAASLLLGFPWADCEDNAVSLITVTNNEPVKAETYAKKLAGEFWSRRAEFKFKSEYCNSRTAVQKAVAAVTQQGLKPVFVSDSGDNPTAGATADATECLEAVLAEIEVVKKLPTPLLYSGFFDEAAVASCARAGEGAVVDITIGGTWDRLNGKKISCRVKVLKVVRGYGTYKSDLALVEFDNIRMSLTSKHIGFGDENLLPALGVNAADYCLVVVKLGYLEACFADIAAYAIMATSKGCSNELLETIPYKKIRRPMYPLDPDMNWSV